MDNEGTIFVGGNLDSGNSDLYAINSSDGKQKWQSSTGDISYSIPAINQDTVYVGADNYTFYKINKSDGKANAIHSFDNRIMASPIVDNNGVIYIGGLNHMFYAFNPDKSIKWQAELSAEIYNGAVIGSNGTIYVVTLDGNIYAFGE